MFNNSHHVAVSGGTLQVFNFPLPGSQNGTSTGFQLLQQTTASNAIHNAYERFAPPRCHPRTRVKVMSIIMNWILSARTLEDSQLIEHIMWLYGKAGAGKSAIAQSIAEQCEAANLLLATFFFSRLDSTCNNGRSLVPTITYQIVSVLPELRKHVEIVIERNPLIFKLSIETQMMSLIVRPLQELYSGIRGGSSLVYPRLVIIDGLNECEDQNTQESILNVVLKTLHRAGLPLFFLITSRPDPHITYVFDSPETTTLHRRLHLDSSFLPDNDILLFIQDSFDQIKRTHPLRNSIPHHWPHPDVPCYLVFKSSGQFIYASVVMKYVNSRRHSPTHRLEIILGLRPALDDSPFADLDALYIHILEALDGAKTALLILGYVILCRHTYQPYNTIQFISSFLVLDPDIVHLCVADLSSVVTVDTANDYHGIKQETISISHASLPDFLLDVSRSGRFHVSETLFHDMLCRQCFRHLNEYARQRRDSKLAAFWPSYMVYSINYLPYHCRKALLTRELLEDLYDFSWLRLRLPIPPFRINLAMAMFLDCLESLKFEGVDEVYSLHLNDYYQFLAIEIPKYYSNPRLTLLLACLTDLRVVQAHAIRNWESLQKFFQIDARLREVDREQGLNLIDIYRTSSKKDVMEPSAHRVDFTRILLRFLKDFQMSGPCSLDKGRYSIAALWCMKYLCDHAKHQWVLSKHGQAMRETRRHHPWKWSRMRKTEGAFRRARKRRRMEYLKDRQAYLENEDMLSVEFGAVEEYWSSEAYVLGLELLPNLLDQCITSPGKLEPELVAFARQRTFGAMMAKFMERSRLARKSITKLLVMDNKG